jgi:RNA polymerase sigma-70 factor, ECF subfamily
LNQAARARSICPAIVPANSLCSPATKKLYKPTRNGVYRVKQAVDWQRQLYETKASELILYGRALGLSHSEAEDVVQEIFVALLKMEQVPKNPVHYAVRGFRNRALNYKRGFLRRITRELEARQWFERDSEESPQECAAMRGLQKLPPDQREVIVLKIWHEHTFEEIGELLQLSPNTVAGRYRYGMEKLRALMGDGRWEREEGVASISHHPSSGITEKNYEDTQFVGRNDAVLDTAAAFSSP